MEFQEPLKGYQDEGSWYRPESAKTQEPEDRFDQLYLLYLLWREEHLGREEHSAIFYKTEGLRPKPNVPSSNIPVKNSLCLQYASCQQQHHQVLLLFVYSC